MTLDELCRRLDGTGVTIGDIGKIVRAFDDLAEEVGGHDKALTLLKERRKQDEVTHQIGCPSLKRELNPDGTVGDVVQTSAQCTCGVDSPTSHGKYS
jgi:hypothetical protein